MAFLKELTWECIEYQDAIRGERMGMILFLKKNESIKIT
jgi:hypothetical protein